MEQGQPPPPKRQREEVAKSFHLVNDKNKKSLSNPFQFPQNYPPEVECALKTKSMMPRTMNRFLTTLARSIYSEKCYPTAREYQHVAQEVIRKYPFLASPAGTPYVRICCIYRLSVVCQKCTKEQSYVNYIVLASTTLKCVP